MVFLKTCTYLLLTVFINCCCVKAILELETSGVLYACLGGTLSVKCSTGADTLRWTVDSLQLPIVLRRGVTKLGTADMATPISTTLTTLYVSRSLNENLSLPLMSTMSTLNTTADLNGTVIICSAETAGQSLANASLLIILARNNSGDINITPSVNISEEFQMNFVAVTLEWLANNGVSYVVYVAPERAINYTGKSSAQLFLSYNIKYNVSVVASLCGISQAVGSIINYKTCPQIVSSGADSVQVTNHRNPAIEGTTITFSCPNELILTGSNTSMCMMNGEWEPDPKRTTCEGSNANITIFIGGFLGGVVLFAGGIVLLIISVVIVRRKKGSSRKRNIPVSSNAHAVTEEPKPNRGYQSEYSLVLKSNLDQSEENHQSKGQKTLVYADMVSSSQQRSDSILNFDSRIEYAQLQEPDDNQFKLPSDIENHPVEVAMESQALSPPILPQH